MARKLFLGILGLGLLTTSLVGFSSVSAYAEDDDENASFEVTVTNITNGSSSNPPGSGQILNGLVVATHKAKFRLFTLGQPASAGLADVAEDASTPLLVAALSADPNVGDVQTNPMDPILPGQSRSVTVTNYGKHRFLSLATMLVTTNDAFTALNGVRLPKRSSAFLAVAYDAGSEGNTELCAHIPGPPCGMPGVKPGGGEGYVSVHSGIHGTGNLIAALRDWRNPVALITIRRLGDDDGSDKSKKSGKGGKGD